MKRNLLVGIIGGAAVGAAASYLMSTTNRKSLVDSVKGLGGTIADSFTDLLGSEENANDLTSGAGTANASNAARGGRGNQSGSMRRG